MDKVIKFQLNCDDYIHLADEAFGKGDIEKDIAYLFKAARLDPSRADIYIKLAGAYSAIDVVELSNRYYFKALCAHPTPEQDDYARTMLALNFAAMGQSDVSEFYVEDFADYFTAEQHDEPERKFHIVYPEGEDYYERLTQRAYALIREQRLDEAMSVLDEVDSRSKHRNLADYLVLMCLMLKDDVDGVIANAKAMLARDGDNLATQCALATAYKMEGKDEEADALIDLILTKDYTTSDDIMLVLPLMINAERHGEIVKYTRRILERVKYNSDVMIWLSEALYNLCNYNEAFNVMRRVENIFGEFTPASAILQLYRQGVRTVPYTAVTPMQTRIDNFKHIEALLLMPVEAAAIAAKDMIGVINWAFLEGDEKLIDLLVSKMCNIILFMHGPFDKTINADDLNREDIADELLGVIFEQLAVGDHSFGVFSRLVIALLDLADGRCDVTLNVVAQGCFKESVTIGNRHYQAMPKPLKQAYRFAVVDILYTDDEPYRALRLLGADINKLMSFKRDIRNQAESKSAKRLEKVSHMRSPVTLMAVLLADVYKDYDDDSDAAAIERYRLNERTYFKYKDILFGEDDDD